MELKHLKEMKRVYDLNIKDLDREELETLVEINYALQCDINDVGWRSELLPDYDVKEINEIIAECKGNKDDLETLITRIWNKGYITGICFVPEND